MAGCCFSKQCYFLPVHSSFDRKWRKLLDQPSHTRGPILCDLVQRRFVDALLLSGFFCQPPLPLPPPRSRLRDHSHTCPMYCLVSRYICVRHYPPPLYPAKESGHSLVLKLHHLGGVSQVNSRRIQSCRGTELGVRVKVRVMHHHHAKTETEKRSALFFRVSRALVVTSTSTLSAVFKNQIDNSLKRSF